MQVASMSFDIDDSYIVWGIIAVAILTFLYSLLLLQQVLAWFSVFFPLVGLYLFWRFVRAVERIAASMER